MVPIYLLVKDTLLKKYSVEKVETAVSSFYKYCDGFTITSHTTQWHSTSTQSNQRCHSNATKLRNTSTRSTYATLRRGPTVSLFNSRF